jgi:hypothetical protein
MFARMCKLLLSGNEYASTGGTNMDYACLLFKLAACSSHIFTFSCRVLKSNRERYIARLKTAACIRAATRKQKFQLRGSKQGMVPDSVKAACPGASSTPSASTVGDCPVNTHANAVAATAAGSSEAAAGKPSTSAVRSKEDHLAKLQMLVQRKLHGKLELQLQLRASLATVPSFGKPLCTR